MHAIRKTKVDHGFSHNIIEELSLKLLLCGETHFWGVEYVGLYWCGD